MDHDALLASLQQAIPGVGFESVPSVDRHATVYVPAADWHETARALRDHADLAFSLLVELTAADFWPREPRFEAIYILVSIARKQRLRVKVRLSGPDAHLPTVTDLWPAANWLEREVWDMFGIVFDGHPDPRR